MYWFKSFEEQKWISVCFTFELSNSTLHTSYDKFAWLFQTFRLYPILPPQSPPCESITVAGQYMTSCWPCCCYFNRRISFCYYLRPSTWPPHLYLLNSIDLCHNGSLVKYSFIHILNSLTSLVWEQKFFWNTRMRPVRLIYLHAHKRIS